MAELNDRRIHGLSQSGGEIVRYERAGKWYCEYRDSRIAITVEDAALFACAEGATAYLGVAGGRRFDSLVREEMARV